MSLINDFMTETLSVTRNTAGDYTTNKGRYTPGSTSSFNEVASVQPMSFKETQLLPEHLRKNDIIKVYTVNKLNPVDEKNGILADTFEWRGDNYIVWGIESWINTDIPHYKTIAYKIDTNGS